MPLLVNQDVKATSEPTYIPIYEIKDGEIYKIVCPSHKHYDGQLAIGSEATGADRCLFLIHKPNGYVRTILAEWFKSSNYKLVHMPDMKVYINYAL